MVMKSLAAFGHFLVVVVENFLPERPDELAGVEEFPVQRDSDISVFGVGHIPKDKIPEPENLRIPV
jgi:hypothetical protein